MGCKGKWLLYAGLAPIVFYCLISWLGSYMIIQSSEDLLKEENYPVETHVIETEDGYLLTVHRVPKVSGVPIYLQHGLLMSSTDWLKNGKDKSLAYLLWDHGYDVWIGNARGNFYSNKHKTLSPSDPQFWDFSWHELGYYDIPAAINYIVKLTNKSIFYVGYSMGASSFSVMASQRPEVAENVRAMVGLAPAVYEHNIRQPFIRIFYGFHRELQSLAKIVGVHQFLGQNSIIDSLFNGICSVNYVKDYVCSNIIFYFFGYNPAQLDYDKIPKYMSTFPAGTSIKLLMHWFQQMAGGEFRNFDHGEKMNLMIYNSSVPPKYDITKIKVPIAAFTSDNDITVSSKDVRHFYEQVPNKLGFYDLSDYSFNHGDFIWGVNATELVYKTIIDIFEHQKFSGNSSKETVT